ncbi:MAG TPA: hypothetical protein PKE55_04755 [Kiritimatiellia bacterium]|nr:hypothetical protein [Kiritimatiellia bacterium]
MEVLIDEARGSQFDRAMQALAGGLELPDGLVCSALCGSGFRGQRQRGWSALRGNLHLSAHYRLGVTASLAQVALTAMPAVVAAEAIARVSEGRLKPGIKWVNDVLLGKAKVSGVLTSTQIEGCQVSRAVFGIGLNVEVTPELEGSLFIPSASCLADLDPGCRGKLPNLYRAVVEGLDREIEALRSGVDTGVFERYRSRADFIGKNVGLWSEDQDRTEGIPPMIKGKVLDLRPDLSLVIEGHSYPVRAGRLAILSE